jgi:FkbM family methyltransferase
VLHVEPFKMAARIFGRLGFVRFGLRSRLARAVEDPGDRGLLGSNGATHNSRKLFRQRFYGGTYVGSTSNYIDWSARYFGAYSIEELALYADIIKCVPLPHNVIDIGANVGNHSLFFALTGASVLAFEPNPDAYELLEQKIRANPGVRIQPFQKALSDRSAFLELCLPDNKNLGRSSFNKKVGSNTISVEVSRADDLEEIQSCSHISYIKIDVEGHELRVLSGLRDTLSSQRPPVFVECNQLDRLETLSNLFPEGYSFYLFDINRAFAYFLNIPGYGLKRVLAGDPIPSACNILAWPDHRLPSHLSRKVIS